VHAADLEKGRAIVRRIRAGQVSINDAFDFEAPCSGDKKSGNGHEWGAYGFHEFLESKAILGYAPT
jgi:aldehyde dehydrogenase (NAD+)